MSEGVLPHDILYRRTGTVKENAEFYGIFVV